MPVDPPAGCPLSPPAEFDEFRSDEPVKQVALPDGTTMWLLTRYDDVRQALRDNRLSSNITLPGFPTYGLPGRDTPEFARSIIRLDAPEHTRLRRLTAGEFTPSAVARHEPLVVSLVTELLDDLGAGGPPGDFVGGFALALPSAVISRLLGVPPEDHEFFENATRAHTSRDASDADVAASLTEFHAYMRTLAERKRRDPGDDVISRLMDHESAGVLTLDEVASYALLLVAAGHDTTAGALALGILTLVQDPAQLDLVGHQSDGWERAADELIRYHSVVRGGPRRLALVDVEIGGCTIRAGDGLMLSTLAANHDDEQFADAATVDVTRDNAASNIAFGFGPHLCLGKSLARLEMRVGLEQVFSRFPSLQLATPFDELPFRSDSTNYGLYSLPLTW